MHTEVSQIPSSRIFKGMKLEEIAKETMVCRKTSVSNTDSYSTTMLIQSSWKETSKETE